MSLIQEAQAGLQAKANNNSANVSAPAFAKPSRFGSPNAVPNMEAFLETGPSPSPPPRPTPAPAPAQVSKARWEGGPGSKWPGHRDAININKGSAASRGASKSSSAGVAPSRDGSGEDVEELGRLVEWRDELLATGMYTAQNPIVSELNRRIQSAGVRGGSGVRLLREE